MSRQQWISPQKKHVVYTRNFTNRLIHWITFFGVIALMVTGYYIGRPTAIYGYGEAYQAFTMASIRLLHFYAAMVLDVTLMVWIYLAFASRYHAYWRDLVPNRERLKGAMEVARSYLTFDKPRFYPHNDPLDGFLFLLLIVLMALQMLSGFHMYALALDPNYWLTQMFRLASDWLVWVMGSSQKVRLFHHTVEWVMLAGIIVHVYLQIAKTVIWRDGHIGQIVGGYKYRDVE